MPEQITSLDNQPTAPLAETLRTTGSDNSEQQSDLITARSQFVRQFVQLLSQSQGQLPQAQEQKLQPLLRQMIPLLTTETGESSAPLPEDQPAEGRTLSQLIQKVIQQLPASDPLLKNLLQTMQGKTTTTTNAMSVSAFPLLEQTRTVLTTLPNASNMDSKSLGVWLLQLLTLRSPALSREQTGTRSELKNALLQQGITLPDQVLLADKQSQSKLLQLGKATVQMMQCLTSSAQTVNIATASGQEKGNAIKPLASALLSPSESNHDDSSLDDTEQSTQEQIGTKRNALLERVGSSLQQLKASIMGSPAENKALLTAKAAVQTEEKMVTPAEITTPTEEPSIKEPKLKEKNSLALSPSPEPGKNGAKAAITPISNEPVSKAQPQRLPLTEFVQVLQQQQGRTPESLRPLMQSLALALQQPLTSDAAVREWIAFLKAPLADNTPLSRNLRQWGATLLAIRFGLQGQLPAEQHKQLNQLLSSTNALLLNQEEQESIGKLTGHFLGQMERMQQQAGEPGQPLPNYIPLPSQHTERRESGISQQANRKTDGCYEWSLNFSLDLGALGAVQIRVKLDLPDLQMQLTAEKMSTVDRIKQTLPLLEQRFKELGLQPVTLGCRQGKVSMPTAVHSSSTIEGGLSIHI